MRMNTTFKWVYPPWNILLLLFYRVSFVGLLILNVNFQFYQLLIHRITEYLFVGFDNKYLCGTFISCKFSLYNTNLKLRMNNDVFTIGSNIVAKTGTVLIETWRATAADSISRFVWRVDFVNRYPGPWACREVADYLDWLYTIVIQ